MQKNPTLDNVVMILCKNTSRNNGKHFDYPLPYCPNRKARNYNKEAMVTRNE